MKSDIYYPGAEFEGVVIEFHNPSEFYCSFIQENDYIKISESKANDVADTPDRSEIVQYKKFSIRVGDENVLCEVLNDLKADEVNCQVLLCNTPVKLKVNSQSLRKIKKNITDENVLSLKIYDFAPKFLSEWNTELTVKLKEKLLFHRFIVQFKSEIPDPVDGRYPVNLLDISDRKSVTDVFIDEKIAIRYSDYYDTWVHYETDRIFDCKDTADRKYIISAPMFKNGSSAPNDKQPSSPKHKFNIEAQPFTPISSKFEHDNTVSLSPTPDSSNFTGFINETGFNNYEMGNLQQNFLEKLTLAPRIKKPDHLPITYGRNITKRIKKSLDVVSPSIARTPLDGVVALTSSSICDTIPLPPSSISDTVAMTPSSIPCPATMSHASIPNMNMYAYLPSSASLPLNTAPFNYRMPFLPLQQQYQWSPGQFMLHRPPLPQSPIDPYFQSMHANTKAAPVSMGYSFPNGRTV